MSRPREMDFMWFLYYLVLLFIVTLYVWNHDLETRLDEIEAKPVPAAVCP